MKDALGLSKGLAGDTEEERTLRKYNVFKRAKMKEIAYRTGIPVLELVKGLPLAGKFTVVMGDKTINTTEDVSGLGVERRGNINLGIIVNFFLKY